MANGRVQELGLREPRAAEVFKALGSEARLAILDLLSDADRNINELGTALGISQPSVTKHVQYLENAGLVVSEYMPGQQGMQKRCRLATEGVLLSFAGTRKPEFQTETIAMPIGLYTLANPSGTCGLAGKERIIGFYDQPQSFFLPDRVNAQILWMADGFVEYTFPCSLPRSVELRRLELQMEVCSEAPDFNPDWPSDITVWINNVELGTWTCPGDFGGERGRLNPDWWVDHMTQFGALKVWSVDSEGSHVDGVPVSEVTLERTMVTPLQPITVRVGVKPDAPHSGGFNLFGRGFGNYAQDLVLRLHYTVPRERNQTAGTALPRRETNATPSSR
ncbi:ArsR family transcriptional regulator [bacterium]|nr:MAG: ArsR family transcriptional regulator [bacterium]